jgi:hypothetical protein
MNRKCGLVPVKRQNIKQPKGATKPVAGPSNVGDY